MASIPAHVNNLRPDRATVNQLKAKIRAGGRGGKQKLDKLPPQAMAAFQNKQGRRVDEVARPLDDVMG